MHPSTSCATWRINRDDLGTCTRFGMCFTRFFIVQSSFLIYQKIQTPADKNDQISIRILVGPSKNLLFDNFPIKYTLPFTRASRTRVTKLGYVVVGNDEHPIEGNEI
jgi:hypothetical protein